MDLTEYVIFKQDKQMEFVVLGKITKHDLLVKFSVGDESCGIALNSEKKFLFAVFYVRLSGISAFAKMNEVVEQYKNLNPESDVIDGLFHNHGVSKLLYKTKWFIYAVYYDGEQRNGIYCYYKNFGVYSFYCPKNVKAELIPYDFKAVATSKPTFHPFGPLKENWCFYRYSWNYQDLEDFVEKLPLLKNPKIDFLKKFGNVSISRTGFVHPNFKSAYMFIETIKAYASNDISGKLQYDASLVFLTTIINFYHINPNYSQLKNMMRSLELISKIQITRNLLEGPDLTDEQEYFMNIAYKFYYFTLNTPFHMPPLKVFETLKFCKTKLNYEFDERINRVIEENILELNF